MMRSYIIILSLAAITVLLSCNQSGPEQKAAPVTATTPGSGIKIEMASLAMSSDPVCGMSITGDVGDTSTYKGKLYGFCSASCKEDFVKDPGQYIKNE